MQLSYAAMKGLVPQPVAETTAQIGDYIKFLFSNVLRNAKPKGQRSSLGPTHPLRGEQAYLRDKAAGARSKHIQFALDELLPDGRHRFYLKNGEYIDRKGN